MQVSEGMSMLEVTAKYQKDGRGLVSVTGTLTITHVETALGQLKAQLGQSQQLVLDLSGISEFDSAGFQLLLYLKQEAARSGKRLKFVGHPACIIDTLELYGAVGLFRDKIVLPPGTEKQGRFRYGIEPQELIHGH